MPKPEAWLLKAKSDLSLAKKGFVGDDETLDSAIYHTQQCAEKSFKGYLELQRHPIKKVHDLVVLLEYCMQFDESFVVLRKEVETLTPFATEFRYPDDYTQFPDRKTVEQAISYAQKIFKFVRDKIYEVISGQQSIFKK